MFPYLSTWTSALIFAAATFVIPINAIANGQIPEHYSASAAAKYDASAVQHGYVGLAGGLYSNALGAALALSNALDALSNAPNVATVAAARGAWISARNAYLATEAFHFYGGPIDALKSERSVAGPELAINANFRLLGRAFSGADNVLIAQFGGKNASSASQRKVLVDAAMALQSDLTFVLKQWDPIRRTGYAQAFLQLEGTEALGRILRGIGMQAVALSKDPRGDDVNAILTGMHSIWHAQLNNITAPSIEALLSKIDANAAAAVSSALASAQTQASAKDPALPATMQKMALAIANAGTSLGVAIHID